MVSTRKKTANGRFFKQLLGFVQDVIIGDAVMVKDNML